MKELGAQDVIDLLAVACKDAGGQSAWAKKHRVSPAYVSDTLSGRRDPGPAICQALGIERIVAYRKTRR